jgi:type I restriction enzyme M protein
VLFRGSAEREIRRHLIEANLIEAVIGLAPNLFYNTTIPACILVFRRRLLAEREGHVLVIDGSARFRKGRNQNEMTAEDVDALTAAYHEARDPDGEGGVHVRLVPHAEIEANDWDLNLGRYVTREAEAELDVAAALAEYQEARDLLREAEGRLDERLAEAGFGA